MPLDNPKPGDARPKEPQVTDSVAGTFKLLGLDTPPKHIGPYRILDVIGEGAMGIVYLAEQAKPIRRQVAIKILKLGMDKGSAGTPEAEQPRVGSRDLRGILPGRRARPPS
jgi:serine/threonine protein kinase